MEPAAKRRALPSPVEADANEAVSTAATIHELPIDVWGLLAEAGELEVADLISVQRSCKALNAKLSDNNTSASKMWSSAVQQSLLFSRISHVKEAVYSEVCNYGLSVSRAVATLRRLWRTTAVASAGKLCDHFPRVDYDAKEQSEAENQLPDDIFLICLLMRASVSLDWGSVDRVKVSQSQFGIDVIVNVSQSASEPYGTISWNDAKFSHFGELLDAIENMVATTMATYDSEIRNRFHSWGGVVWRAPSDEDESTQEGAMVHLRESCAKGDISEVISLVSKDADLLSHAIYFGIVSKQYLMADALSVRLKKGRGKRVQLEKAIKQLVTEGNISILRDWFERDPDLLAYHSSPLASYAAFQGREDLLRMQRQLMPEVPDCFGAAIAILRDHADLFFSVIPPIISKQAPSGWELLFVAVAFAPPPDQGRIGLLINQHLASAQLAASLDFSRAIAIVAQHGTPELKCIVRECIRTHNLGVGIMTSMFESCSLINAATFWGLVELSNLSSAEIIAALPPGMSGEMIMDTLKLIPSAGPALTPAIMEAIRRNHRNARLFHSTKDYMDLAYRDANGNSLLHLSTHVRKESLCFRYLLERGIDPNCRNNKGDTPFHLLMQTTWDDFGECAALLVAHGADYCARNDVGDTVLSASEVRSANIQALRVSGRYPLLFQPSMLAHSLMRLLENRGDDEAFSCVALLVDWGVPVPDVLIDGQSVLHLVAVSRNGALLETLICMVPHLINSKNSKGDTPLKKALSAHRPENAVVLMRNGGIYSEDPSSHEELLNLILSSDRSDLLEVALTSPFVDNISRDALKLSIMIAAKTDMLERLDALTPFGDVNVVENGRTPLIQACENSSHHTSIESLLKAGATQTINHVDHSGRTALFYACQSQTGGSEVVRVLLENGADPKIAISDTEETHDLFLPGWTPLFAAVAGGVGAHGKKLRLLLDAGANINALDKKGNSIMSYLCQNHGLDLIQPILEAGFHVHFVSPNGLLPLSILMGRGYDIPNLLERFTSCVPNFDYSKRDGQNRPYLYFLAWLASADESVWTPEVVDPFCNCLDINERINTVTYLHLACRKGAPGAKYLLEHGADPNLCHNGQNSAFVGMLRNKNDRMDVLKLLVQHGLNLRPEGGTGFFRQSALHHAACYRHFEVVQYLLDCGLDKVFLDFQGLSAFDLAILSPHGSVEDKAELTPELLQLLMPTQLPAQIFSRRMHNSFTPALIHEMIRRGADPKFVDSESGATSLHMAVFVRVQPKCLRVLLESGAASLVNHEANNGSFPLSGATRSRAEQPQILETIKILLEFGADINKKNKKGTNALRESLRDKGLGTFEFLLRSGADPMIPVKDDGVLCPIGHICASVEDEFVIQCLRILADHKYDFKAAMVDSKGNTAIHARTDYTWEGDQTQFFRFMMELGIDINARNNDGHTALIYALDSANEQSIQSTLRPLVALGTDLTLLPVDSVSSILEYCVKFPASDAILRWCLELESSRALGFLETDIPADGNIATWVLTDPRFSAWLEEMALQPFRKHCRVKDAMLFNAASACDAARFELLVANGARLDVRTHKGSSPLVLACTRADAPIPFLELLVDKYGYSVNEKNSKGETPLFYCETESAAKFLIERGADESIKDKDGHLWHAVAPCRQED
eukprot:TRINITY_DN405_c0_g1_i3.p1 TRINITY_DN405_c0_g1~~TRINITY_DN405_c0_g1_i3.p1  ORF type:complete len:1644 (-),score=224.95 TRINITY_DN405_c0_g1_i3:61-4992(-)